MRIKRSLSIAGLIFLPLVIGAASGGWVHQARIATISAARPILEFQDQISHFFRSRAQSLLELPLLAKKNQALREELTQLKGQSILTTELKKENERLKALLGLKEKQVFRVVSARVIGRDPSHWSFFIVLNKGSADGVREEDALLHSDGLVGKVVLVGPHTSRAILLIDRESRAGALNQRTRDSGLIEGTGSLLLKMTYLDRDADIQIGDTILSSGDGGVYPKGVPIGRVQLVGEDEHLLTRYAVVKPFVSFAKLEEVLCVSSQTGG